MDKHSLLQHLARQGFSQQIVAAFAAVKREDYIPEQYTMHAYDDIALPTQAGQTISQPTTIACMLSLLELEMLRNKQAKLLEIGSGSGYVLALLHEMLPRSDISGIELQKSLVKKSRSLLSKYTNIKNTMRPPRLKSRGLGKALVFRMLGLPDMTIIEGSGMHGLPDKAPFNRILVSASAAHFSVIKKLCVQLKHNGILVAPVRNSIFQIKKQRSSLKIREFPGFVFVPLVDKE